MAMIGYVRVSDDKQNEALQVHALQEAGCKKIYSDHGVSGAVTVRTGLDEVLRILQSGDTLAVWKFDRLGRSTVHLLLLFDDLRRRGIHFISTTQGINTSTFEGRIFFGQLALFAEYERELIRERTKAGLAAAKKRGVRLGRPPKLSDKQTETLRTELQKPGAKKSHIARRLGISHRTLNRALER